MQKVRHFLTDRLILDCFHCIYKRMLNDHKDFMQDALFLAEKAEFLGEVPVGAVVVKDNEIIGRGYNQPITSCDPTAHAEIVALREAARHLNNYRLIDCDLYVTIEPCAMCAGAIVHSRIRKVFYGTVEPKAGAVESTQRFFEGDQLNHKVEVEMGILEDQCRNIIQRFFKNKRQAGVENINTEIL